MPKTYSKDFRLQVLSCVKRGKRREEICDYFEIGRSTLDRWIASSARDSVDDYNRRGEYSVRKISSQALLRAVEDNPDKTLHEFAQMFDCCFQAIDQRL